MTAQTVDILIPVYNQPQAVRSLMDSLARYTNAMPADNLTLGRVIIGDDKSDAVTADYLDGLSKSYPSLDITVIHHVENLGYGGNCNALFAESNAEFIVILNTDVVLPPRWLERMMVPLVQDDKAVLATPLSTNAANHTITKNQGQSWRDLDVMMEAIAPSYPDACTAIGFCLGIRCSFFTEQQESLFDEAFKRGYGEDSDLHYRVVSKGYRSVVVDNLVVHHLGGKSFASVEALGELKHQNGALFFSRWQQHYQKDIKDYQKQNMLGERRHHATLRNKWKRTDAALDVLFVLPAIHQRYGGVRIVKAMTDFLINQGYAVNIFVQVPEWEAEDASELGFFPWDQKDKLFQAVRDVKLVIATGHGTVNDAQEIAKHYNAQLDYFIQGPEPYLSGGGFTVKTVQGYDMFERFSTVSTYLTHFLKPFTDKPVENIMLGPDGFVFYDMQQPREKNTIAIAINFEPNKGTGLAISFAIMAKKAGFKVYFFGFDVEGYPDLSQVGDVLGTLDDKAMAQLFNRVEYYADFSYFEGLGLMAMEAAFCGAIPLLTPKGGADYIFTHDKDALFMENFLHMAEMLEQLKGMSEEEKKRLAANAALLRPKYDTHAAFERFESYLQRQYALERTQDAVNPATVSLEKAQLLELLIYRNWRIYVEKMKQEPWAIITTAFEKIKYLLRKHIQALC